MIIKIHFTVTQYSHMTRKFNWVENFTQKMGAVLLVGGTTKEIEKCRMSMMQGCKDSLSPVVLPNVERGFIWKSL